MILNLVVLVVFTILGAILYHMGGVSKEEGKKDFPWVPTWMINTKARDIGVPLVSCLALWKFYGLHWSLLLTFVAMMGALSTYHKYLNKFFKKPKTDCFWFNYLAHGFCIGLSPILYVALYQHNYFGQILLAPILAILVMAWSLSNDVCFKDEVGRGGLIVLSLILLNRTVDKFLSVICIAVVVMIILRSPWFKKLIKKKG